MFVGRGEEKELEDLEKHFSEGMRFQERWER